MKPCISTRRRLAGEHINLTGDYYAEVPGSVQANSGRNDLGTGLARTLRS